MSASIVISDTTAITHLSSIGALNILKSLYTTIYIPEAVYHELTMHGIHVPGAREVQSSLWIMTERVRNRTKVQLLAASLDAGESEAIALAIEKHADLLLIDEKAGRAIAKAEGINIRGVLGVLLDAKNKNVIPLVKPYLDQLKATGFKMSLPLYEETLKLAGEAVISKKA